MTTIHNAMRFPAALAAALLGHGGALVGRGRRHPDGQGPVGEDGRRGHDGHEMAMKDGRMVMRAAIAKPFAGAGESYDPGMPMPAPSA